MQAPSESGLPARSTAIPTTVLSDLLADAGYPDQVFDHAIQAFTPTPNRIAGWAYTVAGDAAAPEESGPDMAKARAIDAMPRGAFAVWSGGGVTGICLFGDLLAAGMAARGVVGAVVDGGVRDIDDIADIPFPVFARYRTPKASSGLWRVRQVQATLHVRGTLGSPVTVKPNDLIVADANGAICLPSDVAHEVIANGEIYLRREDTIRKRIDGGHSLGDLVNEFGRL